MRSHTRQAGFVAASTLLLIVTFISVSSPATADPATPPSPPAANYSTMTVEEQHRLCTERARTTNSASDYQCAVGSKKSQGMTARSAADARENSIASIDELQARRRGTSTQTIAPACSLGYSNPDRFISCSLDGWVVTNYQIINGVPRLVGEMTLDIESSVEFDEPSDGDPTPAWDLNTDVTVTSTYGNLAGGASGSMWTGCWGHPDKCTTSRLGGSNGENEPVNLTPGSVTRKWYTQYSDTLAVNEVNPLYGNLGSAVLLNTPGGQVILVDHAENTLWGRCDGRQNRYGTGCVDDLGPAFVAYDTRFNPAVGPVAQHVFDAIRGLPSHWGSPYGSPLTRLTDLTAINNNRAIACAGVIAPPGQSCDEYPLASSYQGGNGAAPNDRSTRVVPQGANDSQGGLTGAYYDYYRIIDRDPFYVQAVLADGSTAW